MWHWLITTGQIGGSTVITPDTPRVYTDLTGLPNSRTDLMGLANYRQDLTSKENAHDDLVENP